MYFLCRIPQNQIRITIFRLGSELGFTHIQIILLFSLGQIGYQTDLLAWTQTDLLAGTNRLSKLIFSPGRIG